MPRLTMTLANRPVEVKARRGSEATLTAPDSDVTLLARLSREGSVRILPDSPRAGVVPCAGGIEAPLELSDGVQRIDDTGCRRAGGPSSLPAGRHDAASQRTELGDSVLQSRSEFCRGDYAPRGGAGFPSLGRPYRAGEFHAAALLDPDRLSGSGGHDLCLASEGAAALVGGVVPGRGAPDAGRALGDVPRAQSAGCQLGAGRAAECRDRARAARRGPRHGLDADRRRVGQGRRAAALHVSASGDSPHHRNRRRGLPVCIAASSNPPARRWTARCAGSARRW